MLNAHSSTLKSESDDQSRNAPPTIPSAVALSLDRAHRARRSSRPTCSGTIFGSSRTRKLDSSAWPDEPEQREREEEQRHEGEQREVGDHRREVRAAVGEELATICLTWRGSMLGADGRSRRRIAELTEISSQIERGRDRRRRRASLVGSNARRRRRAPSGSPQRGASCSTQADGGRRDARRSRSSRPRPSTGSVFVVRDGGRTIAATTTPEPTVGLVFYDLKTLPALDRRSRPAADKRRAPAKKPVEKADDAAA